jgi:hypothetical protein
MSWQRNDKSCAKLGRWQIYWNLQLQFIRALPRADFLKGRKSDAVRTATDLPHTSIPGT